MNYVRTTLLSLVLASMMVLIDSLNIGPEKHPSIRTKNQRGSNSISKTLPDCSTRRKYVQTFLSVLTFGPATPARANGDDDQTMKQGETVVVPLTYIPSLAAYVIYYSVGGDRFGAILDTGSPFLTVPGYCDKNKYGCYLQEHSQPSGLPPTIEQFDNNEGKVEWRTAPFSFVNGTGSMMGPLAMTFGVLSDSLMGGSGGIFFGLVRDTDSRIRPSFLGQTKVQAFEIDLASSSKTLTLTTDSFLDHSDYIPLVKDLNRKYGDPTIHYTAKAQSLVANNSTVASGKDGKPIYVIFDSGVSGMVVSQELLDERYATARKNRERSLWGSVQISFRTKSGQTMELTATKPLTTPLGRTPWPGFNAHLIVVGLAFLDGSKMTVDIDKQKLWIE
jgi:hypothetical protein